MKPDLNRRKEVQKLINEAISDRWFMWGMTGDEIHNLLLKLRCPEKAFWKSFGEGNTSTMHTCLKCNHAESIFYCCDIEQALARIYKYRTVNSIRRIGC